MTQHQSNRWQQIQRVQVGVEGQIAGKRLKISVENYDEVLGWYSSGSLSVPMHQLPLLQQALQSLDAQTAPEEGMEGGAVIPFPGLRMALRQDPQDS